MLYRGPDWVREGATQERDLTSFGQKQRTALAVKLRHSGGGYVWATGSHLAANVADLTTGIAKAHKTQATEYADWAKGYEQIIGGFDLNDASDAPGTPRAVLKAGGWTFGNHGSIDAIAAKKRVKISRVTEIALGFASDHKNAHLATFTTKETS